MIKSNKKGKLNDTETRFAKEKILVYIINDKIINKNEFNIPKPNIENIK